MHPQFRQIGLLAVLLGSLVSLSLIWLNPRFRRIATEIRKRLERVAARRWAVALAVGCGVMAVRAALLPVWKIPIPSSPDEFSHLLLADTLASGRLTNPPHPMWMHFETPYVLQQPSYASAYPPAQGLFLAAGKVLTGQPWWGVWLSVGIMCAAFCWMLQQWLPPLWAMSGGIWAAMQLGIGTYWMNSYWGGAVPAMGGALVLGSVARLRRGVTAPSCAVLAAGLAVLAASRPYEGGVLGLTAVVYVAWELRRRRLAIPVRAILPGAAILLVFAAALGYYCWRVTGNAFELPQAECMRQYAVTKAFVWQKSPPEPVFRHAVLAAEMRTFLIEERRYNSRLGTFLWTLWKGMRIATFYLGPLMLVPLAMLPWLFRGRFRGLLFLAAASVAAILLTVFLELHYAAPMSGLFYLLTVQSLRILWGARRRGNWLGRFLVPAIPAVCLLSAAQMASPPSARPSHIERQQLIAALARTQEQHLIIVEYGNFHTLADEWVYNEADIDGAPVVWARDTGPLNRELIQYFSGRKVWFLEADTTPPRLRPLVDGTALSQR